MVLNDHSNVAVEANVLSGMVYTAATWGSDLLVCISPRKLSVFLHKQTLTLLSALESRC